MKKRIIAIILAALMLLTACGKANDTPAPTDDTQPTSESTLTQPTDAPTEPESGGEDDFTITEIGTYENIDDEFAGYDIYQSEVKEQSQLVYLPDPQHSEVSSKAYVDDSFICAVRLNTPSNSGYILEKGIGTEEVDHTKLYVFGKIYDIRKAGFYWYTDAGATMQISKELVILNSPGGYQSILIYPNGFHKIYAGKENSNLFEDNTRVFVYDNVDPDTGSAEYLRYYHNSMYVHYYDYSSKQLCRVDDIREYYASIKVEELETTFMMERGTVEMIDGVPQLHSIQSYSIKEWSHSSYCPYAEELEQYKCELNELYELSKDNHE